MSEQRWDLPVLSDYPELDRILDVICNGCDVWAAGSVNPESGELTSLSAWNHYFYEPCFVTFIGSSPERVKPQSYYSSDGLHRVPLRQVIEQAFSKGTLIYYDQVPWWNFDSLQLPYRSEMYRIRGWHDLCRCSRADNLKIIYNQFRRAFAKWPPEPENCEMEVGCE